MRRCLCALARAPLIRNAHQPIPIHSGGVILGADQPPTSVSTTAAGGTAAWARLGLQPPVIAALRELGCAAGPTHTQVHYIPRVLAGESLLLAAGTGTGKTLAFLAPIAQSLKAAEAAAAEERAAAAAAGGGDGGGTLAAVRGARRPRALVLAPTRELAVQTLAAVKGLSHVLKLRSVGILGGSKQASQRRALGGGADGGADAPPVDIVVATPGRLALLQSQGWLSLAAVRHIVVDEADTMVATRGGFLEEVRELLSRLPRGSCAVQHVFVGATMPPAAVRALHALAPSARLSRAMPSVPGLHELPACVTLDVRRVGSLPAAKHEALTVALDELRLGGGGPRALPSSAGPAAAGAVRRQALVFCSSVGSARSTAHFIAERGLSAACLHGDIPPARRAAEFELFRRGDVDLLVCTDAAARGLDFPAAAAVIMFDFPHSAVDFVHRAGRVGRQGQAPRGGAVCIAFATPKDEPLARAIERAARRREPLQLEEVEGTSGSGGDGGGGGGSSSSGSMDGDGGAVSAVGVRPGNGVDANPRERQRNERKHSADMLAQRFAQRPATTPRGGSSPPTNRSGWKSHVKPSPLTSGDLRRSSTASSPSGDWRRVASKAATSRRDARPLREKFRGRAGARV